MMAFEDWLNRKPTGPAPKKRLPVFSAKRAKEGAEYRRKRVAYLTRHPTCQACGKRRAEHIHHKAGRHGGKYLDESSWMAVCFLCHNVIHAHPKEARALGYLE